MAMRLKRAKFNWQFIEPTMSTLNLGGGGGGGSAIDPSTMGMLAKQSADLNRTNTKGTYGSSEWTIDPETGRYKQTVNLDPSQQKQLDTRNQIAEQMIGDAGTSFGSMTGPFNYSDSVSAPARAGFDASMERFKPQFEQQNRTFDQTMSNNGIPIGSEAYNKAEAQLSQGQNDQINQAAEGAVNTQNTMDTSQRNQNFSDIANMLGTQNTQAPISGTQAAIDTTGNFNALNNNVASMYNNAASKQQAGTSALFSLLGAFL